MSANALHNISKIEGSLWEAADQLRANSKLTSSEYCMPVLGVIFLRHATNRYQAALQVIEADQAARKIPKRTLVKGDFIKRRALMLNMFVFSSDLEYSLITAANKVAAAKVMTEVAANGNNYATGYSLDDLRRQIGSKGVPMKKNEDATFKKPFIHRKIADTIDLDNSHSDISRLIAAIEAL